VGLSPLGSFFFELLVFLPLTSIPKNVFILESSMMAQVDQGYKPLRVGAVVKTVVGAAGTAQFLLSFRQGPRQGQQTGDLASSTNYEPLCPVTVSLADLRVPTIHAQHLPLFS
jgi:hypothetical protein